MERLFALSDNLAKHELRVILIQVDEAHSSAWPMALEDQPDPHSTYQERVDRANYFVDTYKPPYDVYIDGWNNEFEQTFRAWPDKYHCIDDELKVVAKAEYGTEGSREAKVVKDYTDLLIELMEQ